MLVQARAKESFQTHQNFRNFIKQLNLREWMPSNIFHVCFYGKVKKQQHEINSSLLQNEPHCVFSFHIKIDCRLQRS